MNEREYGMCVAVWLKLTIGGALLVATHAVLRRATASRGAYYFIPLLSENKVQIQLTLLLECFFKLHGNITLKMFLIHSDFFIEYTLKIG